MKPRFEPDSRSNTGDGLSPTLIDPEAYDASEQTFAASLEQTGSSRPPKFVVEAETSDVPEALPETQSQEEAAELHPEARAAATQAAAPVPAVECGDAVDPEAWRSEVAARLSHYRARRRPREPRYPSLQLKFETQHIWSEPVAEARAFDSSGPDRQGTDRQVFDRTNLDRSASDGPVLHRQAGVEEVSAPRIVERVQPEAKDYPRVLFPASNEATAKVIEFASYNAPPRPFDELAEPVHDRPRIIEAPELVPPAPALGGISIEEVEEPAYERRPGFEIPLRAAPMARRMAAAGIDAALVMAAIAAFAYIFYRITAEVPLPAKVAGPAVLLIGGLWSAYQYLLLVYSGTTPGLKLARLELQKFDGETVPRRTRRWRVLASMLSAVSLGLGYAWCLLDEDELCWHDRVTRTYMAPKK